MNKTPRTTLGILAAAGICLGTQSAQAAPCNENADTILNIAATASSFIPKVGSVASAGIALGGTLLCEEDEPLNVQDVLNIVQAELEGIAVGQAQDDLISAQDMMELLAIELRKDKYAQSDFESLAPDLADDLLSDISFYLFLMREMENDFRSTIERPANFRTTYDLSFAIILANYKLTLVQVATAASNGEFAQELAEDVARDILSDVASYRLEADRLREMTPVAAGSGFIVKRGGEQVFELGRPTRAQVENDSIIPLLKELDAQDAQLSWLKTRALALQEDPFVDLAAVQPSVPRTPVMLKSLSDYNRCVQNLEGRFSPSGVLNEGATRQRDCDPALSSQLWYLENNGQIKSSVAPVCLTAQRDRKGTVLLEECTGGEAGDELSENQVWTRRGDTFEVEIRGTTTCLQNPRNFGKTLRHKNCIPGDPDQVQQWHVYGPMKNGRPPQVPDVDPVNLSFEDIRAISEQFVAGSNQCAARSSNFGDITVTECNRYGHFIVDFFSGSPQALQLWAQDAEGKIFPLDAGQNRDGFVFPLGPIIDDGGTSPGEVIKNNGFFIQDGIRFERNPEADGAVTFARNDGRLLSLRPSDARLFTDAALPDENGDLTDFQVWQHPNGGKFAE